MAAAKSSPYQQGYQKGWLDAWRGVVNLHAAGEEYAPYGKGYRQAVFDFREENNANTKRK